MGAVAPGRPAPRSVVEALSRAPDVQLLRFEIAPPVDATGDPDSDLWLASTFALLAAAWRAEDPLRARLEALWANADLLGRMTHQAAMRGDSETANRLRAVRVVVERWAEQVAEIAPGRRKPG